MNNKAMYNLSYGLFVLTTKQGDKMNGCITNTALQIASDPNTIGVALNKANYTHDMLLDSKIYNLSVLSQAADFDLFKHFGFQSGRDADKFADFKSYELTENGLPIINVGTNAYFSIEVKQTHDLGSHTLFIGQPTAMEVLSDIPSATYAYYQSDIKPKPEKVGTSSSGKTIWRCTVCGYEWEGEELPDDFSCPVCKHPKADFEKIVS